MNLIDQLPPIPPRAPVLIAGPTASGKSALAIEIARRHGGVVVNADASQVFDCWRVITARPSADEERAAPHALYGHVSWRDDYSAGHWLREVTPMLDGPDRPIIT
ncbi:MAG: tRNA (adenosine(37)-N6)-dimethylallyltransferase MiaA, partial [Marinibacterium sp.]|nr:tRNA (adenosine(37)-N6)-dimethylallyltransferase MiaA [Marinibacterium sp.]